MLPSSNNKKNALFYWQTKYPQPEHKKKRKKEREIERRRERQGVTERKMQQLNKYSQKT